MTAEFPVFSPWILAPRTDFDLPPPERPTSFTPGSADSLLSEGFILTVGFSFMIGLALGFALKAAFKVALVVVGLILFALFGLQSLGLLDLNWSGLEVHYEGWIAWLRLNGGAFLDFLGNNLSSATSFMAGLLLGLKI